MKSNEPIIIVLVCDNHLVVMLSVLLKSIEQSHHGKKLIHIYIVNDGISKKNIDKINRTVFSKEIRIFWKTMKEIIPKDFQLPLDSSIYPLNAYVRLFLAYFLPPTINKAIYLDVDMIVLKDIEYLWNNDLNTHTIAAVLDRMGKVSVHWGGIKNYKELGLDPETKYFNSGLLIVDLKQWREMNVTESVLSIIKSNKAFVNYPDQYGLNVFFANNWQELDSRWNNFAQNSNSDPFLVHFTRLKPLFKGYDANLKYKDMFYEILKFTPWNNFTPKSNYVWQTKIVWNMISKGAWNAIAKKTWQAIRENILVSKTR